MQTRRLWPDWPQTKRIGALALIGALLAPVALALEATTVVAPELPAAAASSILALGSSGWRYHQGSEPPNGWTAQRRPWQDGKAPLGFGSDTGELGTQLDSAASDRSISTYFQRSFALATLPDTGLDLTTLADDAVVIFVNGTEVARRNLPSGPVTSDTTATMKVAAATATSRPLHAIVPSSLLNQGTNIIAARVLARSASSSVTFDASLTISAASPQTAAEFTYNYRPGWGAPSWNDDFSYVDSETGEPAIDPTKWNVRDRSDLGLLQDAAVPMKSQATVDDLGIAHLRADWLPKAISRPKGKAGASKIWHKTAYLDQKKLSRSDMSYAQKYGRWEIRAKVPTGPGTYGALAAFWLRNSESGEIDILESWGYNTEAKNDQRIDTATTTVHTNASGSGDSKYYWTHADYGAPTPVWRDFHTWAFELTPAYAAIYCDDELLAKVTPRTHPNLWKRKYFGSPLHVRLNLHVGASKDYWGVPDPDHRSWTKPLDFQVDYVRIWRYEGL